ncbi:hypothetical protein BASA81_011361 [Batrachochytrium salamandrivorans]|nr:hypothetical protein BASA81_011361 [Batrachochytrium salamandrivorans]
MPPSIDQRMTWDVDFARRGPLTTRRKTTTNDQRLCLVCGQSAIQSYLPQVKLSILDPSAMSKRLRWMDSNVEMSGNDLGRF